MASTFARQFPGSIPSSRDEQDRPGDSVAWIED